MPECAGFAQEIYEVFMQRYLNTFHSRSHNIFIANKTKKLKPQTTHEILKEAPTKISVQISERLPLVERWLFQRFIATFHLSVFLLFKLHLRINLSQFRLKLLSSKNVVYGFTRCLLLGIIAQHFRAEVFLESRLVFQVSSKFKVCNCNTDFSHPARLSTLDSTRLDSNEMEEGEIINVTRLEREHYL